ncbi:MAG: UTP--glucose-1-phosphate uridylyltransferase [bacterium]|nr:UTP--glucose-1-phosphate uridylyltransferase [bacterium]
MKKIRKCIIPAAGFGTRFLPATKAMPKEMLPLIDKPIIQYVVEDAVSAGIEDVIIVTGWHKKSIEDHFDYPFELEKRLEASGKEKELAEIREIANLANFIYIRQKGHLGNATPILNARHIVGNEPFLVLWGDDFIKSNPTRSQQLVAAYEKYGSSILSGYKTSKPEDTKKYGFAAGKEIADGVVKVDRVIEKPGQDKVPSDLAIVSGFLFTPEIFDAIEAVEVEEGQELVYVDALNHLLKIQDVYTIEIKNGVYYDTGDKFGYLKALIDIGLEHPDFGDEVKKYLKEKIAE